MGELEKLKVVIEAETKKYHKEVQKVNKSINTMEKGFGKLKKIMIGAFSVALVAKFGKNLMQTANDLKTLSSQTGIGVERLQELQYAAEMSGSSMQALDRGVQTLNQAIAQGSDAYKALNIQATNSGDAFEEVLIKLAEMPDSARKAEIGNKLLGRSYLELKPLLDEGADGIAALTGAARDSGLVMRTELVNSIDSLRQSLSTLGQQFLAAFYPIIEFVIPALQALVNALSYTVGFITGIIRAIFGFKQASEDSSSSIIKNNNDIAKSAAAVAKQYAGFDELNTINTEPSGGGVSGVDFSFDPNVGDEAADALNKARAAAESFNGAIAAGVEAWNKWKTPLAWIAAILASLWAISSIPAILNGMSLLAAGAGLASNAVVFLWGIFEGIGGAIVGLWNKLGFVKFAMDGTGAAALGLGVVFLGVISTVAALWQAFQDNTRNIRDIWEVTWVGIKDTFSTWWSYMEPIIGIIVKTFMDIWNLALKPLWDKFVEFVAGVAIIIMNLWNKIFKPIVDWFIKTLGPIMVLIWAIVGEAVVKAFTTISDIIGKAMDVFNWFVDLVLLLVDDAVAIFQGLIDFVVGVFTGDWEKAWEGVLGIFSGIWNGIKTTFTAVWDWIMKKFNSGGTIFTGIADGISNIFKSLVNGLISGINWIIRKPFDTVNSLMNKIRSFSILGAEPFKKLWGYNPLPVPQIPKLARGGILDAGQMFVAGEAGAETIGSYKGKTTVMPLENTDFVVAMEQAVMRGIAAGAQQTEGGDIVLQIDGMTLARATEKNLNKLSKAKGGLAITF